MFVHSVYFWLKDDLSREEIDDFTAHLESLRKIGSVKQLFIGVPADTNRPVIDRSYSYALIMLFEDQRRHDEYQDDQIHDQFRNECAKYWSRIVIYDCEEQI